MKDLKYYVAGFTAVGMFLYLLHIGQEDMAETLFSNLIIILAFVFGFNATSVAKKENEIEMENMKV